MSYGKNGLKKYSGFTNKSYRIDKTGKCDRCKENNQFLHQNVWLAPKSIYICSKCTDEWSQIFKHLEIKEQIPTFSDFIYKYKPTFVFR